MVQVAVVILNFNTQNQLATFLPKVVAYSGRAEIVVADNGSSDGSADWVAANFPAVRLIRFAENHGFCGGYNRALRQVEAKYYVLLNSDIEVNQGWLEPLVKLLEEHPKVAAAQPKIRAYHRKTHFEHAGAAGGWLDRLGYPFCRGRLFDHLEEDAGQYDDDATIFWATGACLMIRAELYHAFGGLDERFFAHMEEIDLCWRMRQAGWQVMACGKSTVFHVGGGTLQVASPRKTFFNFRNGLFLLVKNLPGSQLLPIIFSRMVLDGVAAIRFLMKGQGSHFWAILRAHSAFYAHLPAIVAQRRKMSFSAEQRKQALSGLGYYPRSLVWAAFVSGRKTFREL